MKIWWKVMKYDGEIWWKVMVKQIKCDGEILVKYDEIWWWNIVKYDLDKGFFVQHCFHHYVHLCVFVVFTTVHVRRLEKVAIPILQTKHYSMIYMCVFQLFKFCINSYWRCMLPKKAACNPLRRPWCTKMYDKHSHHFFSHQLEFDKPFVHPGSFNRKTA